MAEKKKITIRPVLGGKRVISTQPSAGSKVATPVKEEIVEVEKVEDDKPVKRNCYFCQSKTSPSYTDLANLKRYLTERAKIVPKQRSGACSKHQRAVTKNIKYARHLSLLPFVPKV